MESHALRRVVGVLSALWITTLAAALPAQAAHETPAVVASIPIEHNPPAVAVNERTNRVYTLSSVGSSVVSVVDGATNAVIATVPLGTPANVSSGAVGVAVDETTNRIYVASYASSTVFVIDGAANALVATIPIDHPYGIAVNEATGLIYVTNYASNALTVIDGATNATVAIVPVGLTPQGVAVNAATNSIYVVNHTGHTVSVVDGASHAVVGTISVGLYPWNVAVNPRTNRVYVTDQPPNVSVIDGFTNSVVATVPLGTSSLFAIDVNTSRNLVYVTGVYSGLFVIDGSTDAVVTTYPLDSLGYGIGINEQTDVVYVADYVNSRLLVVEDITSQMLGDHVQELVPGALNRGQANGLRAHLAVATRHLENGDEDGAVRALEAFVAQVSAFIKAGVLTVSEGADLTNKANALLAFLRR